jgi:predicted transcriptional regulator
MLESLFSSKTRIKILKLFLMDQKKKYYLREISKVLGEPLTPIRREMLNLKKVGLLERRKVANLTVYSLNINFLLVDELTSMIAKMYGIETMIQKRSLTAVPQGENAA